MISKPLIVVDNLAKASHLLVIDVSNLAYRAAWAYGDKKDKNGVPRAKPLMTPDGRFSGHVFGSVRLLITTLKNELGPGDWGLVFCYDGLNSKVKRQSILPTYKADRDDGRFNPCPEVKEALQLIPGIHVEMDDKEGDDAIAYICSKFGPTDKKLVLMTGDRDLWAQMKYPNVTVWSPNLKRFVSHEDIQAKYLVRNPAKVHLSKAFFGDDSDGIKGVFRLLKKHVEPALNDSDVVEPCQLWSKDFGIPAKTMEKLNENRELIETNYKVVVPDIEGFSHQAIRFTRDNGTLKERLDNHLLGWHCRSLPEQTGIFFGQATYVKDKMEEDESNAQPLADDPDE